MKRVSAALLCLGTAAAQWLDVPFVQQTKQGCGSAAVAMVIQYWARRNPALDAAAAGTERIEKSLRPASLGIQGKALKQYLEAHGFDAFLFTGELADLGHHLQQGRPVVVCLGLKGPRKPLHYVVVAGMDERSVWLNDPARGKLAREDLASFQTAWKITGNWAMLAVPRTTP